MKKKGHDFMENQDRYVDIGEGISLKVTKDAEFTLVNNETGKSRTFVSADGILLVDNSDIDYNAIEEVYDRGKHKVKLVEYGFHIYSDFKDGFCRLEWVLYPDGIYFADSDGYGMEDNDEERVVCTIDRNFDIVEPFRPENYTDKAKPTAPAKTHTTSDPVLTDEIIDDTTAASSDSLNYIEPYINKNMETKITTETKTTVNVNIESEENQMMNKIKPKGLGKLDMVIAFDTTGSMAAYIDDVRHQVSDMVPRLFKDNEDLRLGIVAFGDYCDMNNREDFGDAYQFIPLTNNENDIIKFVKESKDTNGGDGDEFYELVLKKIIDESPWREDSSKAILLIADADPHEIGYTYEDCVVGNQIDWKTEAKKAAKMKIKIDTVSICGRPWYKELSAMTNGISVPFKSSGKTGAMIETATTARSAMAFTESAYRSEDESVHSFCMARRTSLMGRLQDLFKDCNDDELNDICESYSEEVDKL